MLPQHTATGARALFGAEGQASGILDQHWGSTAPHCAPGGLCSPSPQRRAWPRMGTDHPKPSGPILPGLCTCCPFPSHSAFSLLPLLQTHQHCLSAFFWLPPHCLWSPLRPRAPAALTGPPLRCHALHRHPHSNRLPCVFGSEPSSPSLPPVAEQRTITCSSPLPWQDQPLVEGPTLTLFSPNLPLSSLPHGSHCTLY